MKSLLTDRIKNRLNHTSIFGWRIPKILSLLRFIVRRIVEGELTQVAGSLTFVTVLSLVPVLTIALAIFTAFPLFTTFRDSLEAYFIQNLMPHSLSTNILSYLNQFAAKASGLSAFGAVALIVTSIITLATIDRVFNQIWHVKRQRPLIKRMLVYWALITLAPLLIGISLTVTAYVFAATSDVVGAISENRALYALASVIFTTCAFGLLYRVVPNRPIDWRDAAWGGLIAAILFEIAKRIFAAVVMQIPTYTIVYGAVAIIPLFLVWIYTSWLITLFGAVITAILPIVRYERWWHVIKPGSCFIDAMAILEVLCKARTKSEQAGVSSWEIRKKAHLGLDEIDTLLSQMMTAGWVGRLDETEIASRKSMSGSEYWVLLRNPAHIPMSHVYRLFLFAPQTDARLSHKVEAAIEQGLQESLEDYFEK